MKLLSDGQAAAFGRFAGPPSREQLERYFLLDDADRGLVAKRRGDHNRLGFALQLTTARFLGTFLAEPAEVPCVVVEFLGSQLGVADLSCAKAYAARLPTQHEHAREIREVCGYRDFAEAEEELWVPSVGVQESLLALVTGTLKIRDDAPRSTVVTRDNNESCAAAQGTPSWAPTERGQSQQDGPPNKPRKPHGRGDQVHLARHRCTRRARSRLRYPYVLDARGAGVAHARCWRSRDAVVSGMRNADSALAIADSRWQSQRCRSPSSATVPS